jgi:hypothetical protein
VIFVSLVGGFLDGWMPSCILIICQVSRFYGFNGWRHVGIGADLGFNTQEHTNKALTTDPLGNTCEIDELSPEVEAGVVARLRCLQP